MIVVSYEKTSRKLEVVMGIMGIIPTKGDISPIELVINTVGSMRIHCQKGNSFEIWKTEWGDICLSYNKFLKGNPEGLVMTEDDLRNMYERVQKGWGRKQ